MVAQFLRLRVNLLGNTLRRNPWQATGMIVALVVGLLLAAGVTVSLASLRESPPDIARAVVVVFGSAIVAGSLLLPLVFGADDPLDPRRFALFGILTPRLAIWLAVAAFISIPSLVVTGFAVAQIVTWSRDASTTLLAVVAAVLIVATCVLASRVSAAVAALWLSGRRAREGAGIVLFAVLALLAPLIAFMATTDWESRGLPVMRRIAAIATWTPLGAVWSIPADAATDRPELWAKALIAVGFLVGLWLAWRLLVTVMLAASTRPASQRARRGLGWFARMPATPGGAIAARSLSYWGRDPRYRVALLVVPIIAVLVVIVLLIAGVPTQIVAWIPVPLMCLFLGWSLHNDLALDSSAFWEHVSSSARGSSDRFGRTVPALFLGLPLVLVGSVLTAYFLADWATLPALIGLSAGLLLGGLAVSSVVSAAAPYATVHPGDSPFASPQAVGSTGLIVQAFSFFLTALSAAPAVYFSWLGVTTSPIWFWVACAYGVGGGLVALAIGVVIGGAIVNRRAPELLEFTLQN